MNKSILNFKHSGIISFWEIQNDKNYPQWNLACDDLGRNSLIDLLTLMRLDAWSSKTIRSNCSPLTLNQTWLSNFKEIRSYDLLQINSIKEDQLKSKIHGAENTITLTLNADTLLQLMEHLKNKSFDIVMTLDDFSEFGFW